MNPEEGAGPQEGIGGAEEPPQVDDPALRQSLDEIRDHLEEGRPAQARQQAQALVADAPQVAPLARLWVAVADLRQGQHKQAEASLRALSQDEDVDVVVRRAAVLYQALALGLQGDSRAARSLLRDAYPLSAPSPLLLVSDGAPAMTLVAQAHAMAGRDREALSAWSWVYELGDPAARLLARSRALELLRDQAEEEALLGLVESSDDFTRGYAGAALLLRATAGPDRPALSPERRMRLGEVYRQIAPALLRLQEQGLAEELALRLAHAAGPQAVRLGLLLPLSGQDRPVGERALGGALVAQGVFRPGAAARSTLLLKDTGSDPEGARRGVQELVAQGASLIVGPLDGQEAEAAAETAESLGVPMIALSLDKEVVQRGPRVFRLFWDSRREVELLLQQAQRAGARRVGVLHPSLPLARRLAEAAQELAPSYGLQVVQVMDYDPGASDFRKEARGMARARVDAVFVPDLAPRVARVLPFLATEQLWCRPAAQQQEGRHILCLGNATWSQPQLLASGDDYATGALIATSYSPLAPTEENRRFVQAHRAMLGQDPDMIAAFTYDAVRLARVLTLERRAGDAEEVQAALANLGSWPGVTGTVAVQADGEISISPLLLTVQGQGFELWQPPSEP